MQSRVLATAVILAATTLLAAPAHADEVDPEAPVVVDDAVTLWPGGSTEIDVLANDSDPAGDDLALCRLPPAFPFLVDQPPVAVLDESIFGGPVGTLAVQAGPRARGTHTIDYYVCSHTRLTPAHLTVTIRPVQPVDVVPDDVPDRILVTNHNDHRITLLATDRAGCEVDVSARVAAGETRSFKVRRHNLRWYAFIGSGKSTGIADFGWVRHVELTRPPAPPSRPGEICISSVSRLARQLAG